MIRNDTSRLHSTLILLLAAGAGACGGCPGERSGGGAASGRAATASSARLAEVPATGEATDIRFSDDGRHVAFVVTQDGQSWVQTDSKRYGPYDGARGIEWPAGRQEPVFVARRGGEERLVVDGKESKAFREISRVRLAAGGRPIYAALWADKWRLVAGDRELEVSSAIDPEPVPSPDGKRVTFLEQQVKDGPLNLRSCSLELDACAAGASYEAIAWQQAARGGPVAAVVASRGGRDLVLTVDLGAPGHGEHAGGWYDAVAMVAVSADGRRVAALARQGARHLLLVDGVETEVPRIDSPLDLLVAADGRTMLTGIVAGRVALLLSGRRAAIAAEEVYFPRLSPVGTGSVFVDEREGRSTLVVDEQAGPTYDKIVGPAYSPDGARLGFRARQDGRRFVVITDARGKSLRELPRHEAVFEFAFSPDGKSVGYGVQDGRELKWMTEPL